MPQQSTVLEYVGENVCEMDIRMCGQIVRECGTVDKVAENAGKKGGCHWHTANT